MLGSGTRIIGGWQLNDVLLLTNSTVRARGIISGGRYNGSSWFVENIIQITNTLPKIHSADEFGSGSNQFGFNISGAVGQSVIVESSTNLLNWIPITTNTLDTGLFHFGEPRSNLWQFYRVRSE